MCLREKKIFKRKKVEVESSCQSAKTVTKGEIVKEMYTRRNRLNTIDCEN